MPRPVTEDRVAHELETVLLVTGAQEVPVTSTYDREALLDPCRRLARVTGGR